MAFDQFKEQIRTVETSELEVLQRECQARCRQTQNASIRKNFVLLIETLRDELRIRAMHKKPFPFLHLSDEELLKALSD